MTEPPPPPGDLVAPPPPPPATSTSADPETTLALKAADHAHAENLQKAELGWLGKCLGGEKSAPTSIAFIVVIITFVVATGALIAAAMHDKAPAEFMNVFERCFTLLSACLAYIFGRGTRPEK